MKVMELCLSPDLGGLELYMYRSAVALARNHSVIAVVQPSGRLKERLQAHADIPARAFEPASGYLPLLRARRLAGIIDAEQVDAIHMHWGRDLALAALAKKLARRKPAIIYTRQMKITRSKDDPYHRMLYRQVDRMLTITRKLAAEGRRFIPTLADRIEPLYYGVKEPASLLSAATVRQRRSEAGLGGEDFIVGLLGRLERNKGQYLLIEAVAMAREDHREVRALIVGHEMNPGFRAELAQLAERRGVQDNIVFRDFTDEPQQLMQLCDCILLASHEETFGLVLAEAMRAGVAVIGSDRGGVPEIIDDMQTGLLFESANAASLYAAVRKLQDDAQLKRQLAAAGKEKADRMFNEDDHFTKLEQHLLDAVC